MIKERDGGGGDIERHRMVERRDRKRGIQKLEYERDRK
jgi:hypothetical protein